jgi:Ca-activated chloride channel family protein
MWNVEYPFVLLLLIPAALLVWFTYIRKGRGGLVAFSYSLWNGDQLRPPASFRGFVRRASVFAAVCGMCLYVIALAGPIIVQTEKVYLSKGIDMVIALDESPSMSAPDFRPTNRFECAKQVITRFVRGRENDQIGLVTFASDAALRVPPTFDYGFLARTIATLRIMELGEGTAIGMGIAVAALHLSYSTTKDKVIVLLTDGMNNEGSVSPLDAAASAYRMGIRIYTIGIGKAEDLEWTFADPNTGKPYTARSGQFDEGLLKSIAEMSGARYFYAGEPEVLRAIFSEIDSIETTERRVRTVATNTQIYEWFVIAGFALLALSYFFRASVARELV